MNFNVRFLAVNLLSFFTWLVEGLLGIRFLLKLFGASQGSTFVQWWYNMSGALLAPFRGVFPAAVVQNRYVLELSTIFAMVMYAILALILLWVINWAAPETVVTKKARR
jgi:hypothetical protein